MEQSEQLEKLRAFAQDVMESWPIGDLDGGELQDLALKHGLLMAETRHSPCGDNCSCSEYMDQGDFKDGVVCLRKTELLPGLLLDGLR